MPLNDKLKSLHKDVINSLPSDVSKKLLQENEKLFSNFLYEKILKKGSKIPDVFFRDSVLEAHYLSDILKDQHVVLSFFRGTWCPYCNLELKALSNINNEIKEKGARLIAVSPELYKFSKKSLQENNIDYDVMTDLGNKAAKEFGLAFKLPQEYRDIYAKLNIHLNTLNGEDNWILPVPATFIISKDGTVISTYINADYTKRMEPEDILGALDILNS